MNNLVDTLNGISGSILGNPEFQHPLKRYENPANVPGPGLRAGEGSFRLRPGDVQPPAQAGPAQMQPPPPQPGAFGAPSQQRYVPGEGPAPALPPAPSTRPTPPTATSTLAQDEAYRQSVAPRPAPAPAPSSPAARQAPGRQSQAPPAAGQTRVARASTLKVMNLADVAEAVRQTGRSRAEVERRARELGYTVYGSKLPLPTALA